MAVAPVGAGVGEIVGSDLKEAPVDTVVMGIADVVEVPARQIHRSKS